MRHSLRSRQQTATFSIDRAMEFRCKILSTSQIRSWPVLWKRRHAATFFALGYWLLTASVFIGAAWYRFQLPSTPIADPDTCGYLSPR